MNIKRFAPPWILGVAVVLIAGCQSTRLPAADSTTSHPANTEAAPSPEQKPPDIYTKDLTAFASPETDLGLSDAADEHAHHMPMTVEDDANAEPPAADHSAHNPVETGQPESGGFPDRVIELLNDIDRALGNINQQLQEEKHTRIAFNARVIIDALDTLPQIQVPADPHVWHKTMKELKTMRNLALALESTTSHVERTRLDQALEREFNAFLRVIEFSWPVEEKSAHNHGGEK